MIFFYGVTMESYPYTAVNNRSRKSSYQRLHNFFRFVQVVHKNYAGNDEIFKYKLVSDADDYIAKPFYHYGFLSGIKESKRILDIQSEKIKDYDSSGRYGGEEFLIILLECDQPQNLIITQKIKACFENTSTNYFKRKIIIVVSIDAANYQAFIKIDAKEIIQAADTALNHTKNSGSSKIAFAASEDFDLLSCIIW